MATTIDKRVVQMEFDNKQFESGVKTSLSTLEQLKTALNMEGVGKGLDDISKSVGRIDLSNINSSLSMISDRFSTWGIVGMTAIQNITNGVMDLGSKMVSSILHNPLMEQGQKVFSQIAEGGMSRALKLEDAQFKLKNLLETEEEVRDVMGAVSDSVKGTAFGLDEAAGTAATLVTSGVKDADELRERLTTIADVAGMAGSSFSEMGYIFSKVAAKGKAQGDEIRMLAERSIDVYSALENYLGLSREEIEEASRKGLIDFNTFCEALAGMYGGSAKKANETYTGALANTQAALSRIGAKVQTHRLEAMKNIFNSLMPLIDGVNSALGVFIGYTTDDGINVNGYINDLLDRFAAFSTDKLDAITSWIVGSKKEIYAISEMLVAAFTNLEAAVLPILQTMGEAFISVFPPVTLKTIEGLTTRFANWTKGLARNDKQLAAFKKTLTGVLLVIRGFGKVVLLGIKLFASLFKFSVNLFKSIFSITSQAGLSVDVFKIIITVLDTISGLIQKVTTFINSLTSTIKSNGIIGLFDLIISKFEGLSKVKGIIGLLSGAIRTWLQIGKDAYKTITGWFSDFGKHGSKLNIKSILNPKVVKEQLQKIIDAVADFITNIPNQLASFLETVRDSLPESFKTAKEKIDEFIGFLKEEVPKAVDTAKNKLDELAGVVKDNLPTSFLDAKKKLAKFLDYIATSVPLKIEAARQAIGNLASAIAYFVGGKTSGTRAMPGEAGNNPIIVFVETLIEKYPIIQDIIDFLVKAKEKLEKFLSDLLKFITGKFGNPKEIFSNFSKTIQAIGSGIIDGLSKIPFSKILSGVTAGSLVWFLWQVSGIIGSFRKVIDSAGSIPSALSGALKSIAKAMDAYADTKRAQTIVYVAQALLALVLSLIALSQVPEEQLTQVATTLIALMLVLALVFKAVGTMGDKTITKDSNNITNNINLMSGIGEALKSMGESLGKGLAELGKSVGRAATIWGVVALLLALMGAFVLFDKTFGGEEGMNRFKQTAIQVGGILGAITAMCILINQAGASNMSIGSAATIVAIVMGLVAIAGAVAILSALPLDYGKGLAAIGVIALILGLLTIAVGYVAGASYNTKDILPVVGAILVLVLAINLLIPPLLVLSALGDKGMQAVISMSIIIMALMAFIGVMALIAKAEVNIASVAILASVSIILAAALIVIAKALEILSQEQIAVGIDRMIGLSVGLAILIGALTLFGPAIQPGLLALGEIALSCLAVGGAIALFGIGCALVGIGIQTIAAGLEPFIDAVIGFAQKLVENAPIIFAAFLVVLGMISAAIVASQASMSLAIVGLVAGIIIGLISALSQMSPEVFEAFAKIILDGIYYLASIINVIVDALIVLLIKLIDGLADAVRTRGRDFARALKNLALAMVQLLIDMVVELLGPAVEWLVSKIDKSYDKDAYKATTDKSMSDFESWVNENSSELDIDTQIRPSENSGMSEADAQQLVEDTRNKIQNEADNSNPIDWKTSIAGATGSIPDLLKGKGITDGVGNMLNTEMLTDIGNTDFSGIPEELSGGMVDLEAFSNAGEKDTDSFINQFTNGETTANAANAGAEVASEGAKGADSRYDDFIVAGVNAVTGFINGLVSRMTDVSNSSADIATTALTSMENRLDEHSPSRESFTIGDFFAQGFINAIIKRIKDVRQTTAELGSESLNGLHEAMAGIASAVDSDINVDPTIRPVLDLSGVQSGAAAIDDLMNKERFATANVNVNGRFDPNTSRLDGILGRLNLNDQNGQTLLEKMSRQYDLLAEMLDAYKNMPMVLDSGALVGGIAEQMDNALGYRAQLVGRW